MPEVEVRGHGSTWAWKCLGCNAIGYPFRELRSAEMVANDHLRYEHEGQDGSVVVRQDSQPLLLTGRLPVSNATGVDVVIQSLDYGGDTVWRWKCQGCNGSSTRFLNPSDAERGAWNHLQARHGSVTKSVVPPVNRSAKTGVTIREVEL